jgi:hypothetical protein
VSQMKLPARGMFVEQVHGAAPVHIVRLVAARALLTYVISGDDVAKIREGR